MQEIETRGIPGERHAAGADEAVAWAFEQKAQLVDLKFCDLLGSWQHMTLPVSAFGTSAFDRGARLRRLLDPRLAGDRRERPAAHAGPGGARSSTRSRRRRRSRSSARSPTRRPARPTGATRAASPGGRRSYLRETGIADTAYFGPGVRVLRLRRGLLRARAAPRRTTPSTRPRATGTRPCPASATRCARRAATSRRRRTTRCTTSARRSC